MIRRLVPLCAVVIVLVMVVAASTLAAPGQRGKSDALRAAPADGAQPPAVLADDEDEESDGPPSPELIDRLLGKLGDAGVTAEAEQIADLAERYGVGGAVRLLAWAEASGTSTEDIATMFDSGMGWGEIAKELDQHPGIGWVMGNAGGNGAGNGLGRENAPGQQKKQQ